MTYEGAIVSNTVVDPVAARTGAVPGVETGVEPRPDEEP
jgi:hypothetical protein